MNKLKLLPEIPEGETLFTRAEVARHFKVSKETIRRWEGRGLLLPVILNARVYRYLLSDIQQLINQK